MYVDARERVGERGEGTQEVVLGGARVLPPADEQPHPDLVLQRGLADGVVDRRPEPTNSTQTYIHDTTISIYYILQYTRLKEVDKDASFTYLVQLYQI